MELLSERLIMKSELIISDNGLLISNKLGNDSASTISLLEIQPNKVETNGFTFYLKEKPSVQVCHIGISNHRKPFEISYGTEEAYQKQGFMSEALYMSLEWIFTHTKTEIIYGLINKNNMKSIKTAKRVGFYKTDETYEGEFWYAITKEIWNRK